MKIGQKCGSEKVNSANFETYNICQILSFLCRQKYNVFHHGIFAVSRMHHWPHIEFFPEFFETLKHGI